MVEAIDAIARKHAPLAVGTVGLMEVRPNSRNVVPADVFFTVDFRHPESAVLDAMEKQARAAIETVLADLNLSGEWKLILEYPPVVFDADCVAAVRKAAQACGYSSRDIISGAGHDAAHISRVAPAAMVFVPCKDGISHNELEDATQADCAAGANVLMHTVLALAGVAS
jgi:N-carbamoyl-L-amino-acid hydrolase